MIQSCQDCGEPIEPDFVLGQTLCGVPLRKVCAVCFEASLHDPYGLVSDSPTPLHHYDSVTITVKTAEVPTPVASVTIENPKRYICPLCFGDWDLPHEASHKPGCPVDLSRH